jgi:hypothetical protein
MATQDNHGITITGGSVNIGAAAVGAHSTASNVGAFPQLDELRVQVRQLVEALENQAAALPEGSTALSYAAALQEEAAQETPSKSVLSQLLSRINDAVTSVAPLVEAVATVARLVALL